jgi:NAD(P)-dependent dehydrogenase (short-subunit alcohol dehydrogenase family)
MPLPEDSLSERTGNRFKWSASHLHSSDGAKFGRVTALGISFAAVYAGFRILAKNSRRERLNFKDKLVLITGGSRGLGLAMAKDFGSQGARLAICARDAEELDQARNILAKDGIAAHVFVCDVTKKTEVETLVEQVIAQFGRIDVLVNNAGLIKVSPLDNLEVSDFDDAMNLMFWAPFHLTMAVLPHMRKHSNGNIINIASIGGRVSVPHLLPYSCAKFALVGFSNGLAAEVQGHNINVLTVCPGLMRTGSYLRAEFKGKVENEFGWFGLLGNLPGFSVAVEYAARQIREAAEARRHNCTISLPAKILIGADAMLPELTQTIMGAVSSLLPGAGTNSSVAGESVNPKFGGLFQALTTLGRQAARRWNESS